MREGPPITVDTESVPNTEPDDKLLQQENVVLEEPSTKEVGTDTTPPASPETGADASTQEDTRSSWERARDEYHVFSAQLREAGAAYQDSLAAFEEQKQNTSLLQRMVRSGDLEPFENAREAAITAERTYNSLLNQVRDKREERIHAFVRGNTREVSLQEERNMVPEEREQHMLALHEAVLLRQMNHHATGIEQIRGVGEKKEAGPLLQAYQRFSPYVFGSTVKGRMWRRALAGGVVGLASAGWSAGAAGAVRGLAGLFGGAGAAFAIKKYGDKFVEHQAEKAQEELKENFSETDLSTARNEILRIRRNTRLGKHAATAAAGVGAFVVGSEAGAASGEIFGQDYTLGAGTARALETYADRAKWVGGKIGEGAEELVGIGSAQAAEVDPAYHQQGGNIHPDRPPLTRDQEFEIIKQATKLDQEVMRRLSALPGNIWDGQSVSSVLEDHSGSPGSIAAGRIIDFMKEYGIGTEDVDGLGSRFRFGAWLSSAVQQYLLQERGNATALEHVLNEAQSGAGHSGGAGVEQQGGLVEQLTQSQQNAIHAIEDVYQEVYNASSSGLQIEGTPIERMRVLADKLIRQDQVMIDRVPAGMRNDPMFQKIIQPAQARIDALRTAVAQLAGEMQGSRTTHPIGEATSHTSNVPPHQVPPVETRPQGAKVPEVSQISGKTYADPNIPQDHWHHDGDTWSYEGPSGKRIPINASRVPPAILEQDAASARAHPTGNEDTAQRTARHDRAPLTGEQGREILQRANVVHDDILDKLSALPGDISEEQSVSSILEDTRGKPGNMAARRIIDFMKEHGIDTKGVNGLGSQSSFGAWLSDAVEKYLTQERGNATALDRVVELAQKEGIHATQLATIEYGGISPEQANQFFASLSAPQREAIGVIEKIYQETYHGTSYALQLPNASVEEMKTVAFENMSKIAEHLIQDHQQAINNTPVGIQNMPDTVRAELADKQNRIDTLRTAVAQLAGEMQGSRTTHPIGEATSHTSNVPPRPVAPAETHSPEASRVPPLTRDEEFAIVNQATELDQKVIERLSALPGGINLEGQSVSSVLEDVSRSPGNVAARRIIDFMGKHGIGTEDVDGYGPRFRFGAWLAGAVEKYLTQERGDATALERLVNDVQKEGIHSTQLATIESGGLSAEQANQFFESLTPPQREAVSVIEKIYQETYQGTSYALKLPNASIAEMKTVAFEKMSKVANYMIQDQQQKIDSTPSYMRNNPEYQKIAHEAQGRITTLSAALAQLK